MLVFQVKGAGEIGEHDLRECTRQLGELLAGPVEHKAHDMLIVPDDPGANLQSIFLHILILELVLVKFE